MHLYVGCGRRSTMFSERQSPHPSSGQFTRNPQTVGQASSQSAVLRLPVPCPGVGSGCCCSSSSFLSLVVFVVGLFLFLSLSLLFFVVVVLFDDFVVVVVLCFFSGASVFSGFGQDHYSTEIISVGAKISTSTKHPFVFYFYALFSFTYCMHAY